MIKHHRMARVCAWGVALPLVIAALAGAPPPAQPVEAGRKNPGSSAGGAILEFNQLLTVEAKRKLTPEFLRDHAGAEIKSFGQVEEVGKPLTAKSEETLILSAFQSAFRTLR